MKIGPLDIGIKTLAFAAGIVVVAMLDLRLVLSNSTTRAEGFYSSRIPQYLMTGIQRDYEEGVTQCDQLLMVLARNVPARLFQATFLYRQNNFDKAKQAFQSIAEDAGASAQQRAMASFGVGTAIFRGRPAAEKTTAAVEACDWFLKALKSDPELTDAKVGILAASLWRLSTVDGKETAPEAQAVHKQVGEWLLQVLKQETGAEPFSADSITALLLKVVEAVEKDRRPPNLEGMATFYHLKGLVLGRAAQATECEAAFDSAQSVRLRWDPAALNQWRMMLKLLPEAKMKLVDRENLLNEYQKRSSRYPKDSVPAINALAVGWYRMKDVAKATDFANRYFPKALAALKPGYEAGDPIAMMNAIALMDERLFGSGTGVGLLDSISADFFLPFPPRVTANPWKGGGETKKDSVSSEARKLLKPISETADAMRKLLIDSAKKVRLDPKREVELKLRLLACDTLLALMVEGSEGLARRAALAPRAAELKAQANDVPGVLKAYAYFMLCTGDYVEAGKALRRSFELDPNDEKIKKLIAVVSATPALIQPRPTKMGWFGNRAFVRVTLLSPESPGGMVTGEMSFDGQKVEAQTMGSQLAYLIPEGQLSDGKHVVKASALDGYGNKAETEFEFGVDRIPPKVVVEPMPGGEIVGPLPTWTLKLSDEGVGVDLASVQVRLNNVGSGSTPCRSVLVENGIYQVDMPGAEAKRSERVPGETFKVASVRELMTGQYELTISFADQAGNKRNQSWTYQVK